MSQTLATLHTSGDGHWSKVSKPVEITDVKLAFVYSGDGYSCGELCIAFNTDGWNIYKDGLIYTDKQFLTELREFLNSIGLVGQDVEYSEHGMQGEDFVSCDVGAEFLNSYKEAQPYLYSSALHVGIDEGDVQDVEEDAPL